jgi:hypothetical protein
MAGFKEMVHLSASQILQLWETGCDLLPLDRALLILSAALPEETWESLSDLPIGGRDERLLCLQLATFGPQLACRASCPHCDERVEFDMEISPLFEIGSNPPMTELEFDWVAPSGLALRCRLPNSRDLAAAGASEAQDPRRYLAERCILQGEVVRLTSEDLDCLAVEMAGRDPLADIRFDLSCPGCHKAWQAPLDIAAYLWQELSAEARHLANKVAWLARFYGWREADILAMSARRRQLYLELAGTWSSP